MRSFSLILAIATVFSAVARANDPFTPIHESLDRRLTDMLAPAPLEPPSATPAVEAPPDRVQPAMETILEAEGVPRALMAVMLVESGGKTDALSPKGARGLWQLMPDTARQYGLEVGPRRDERLDLVPATRAAARFLRDLYASFGDWRLALAGYNAGPQAVENALRSARGGDFWRLLPEETRRYVPAVLAVMARLGGLEGASNAAGLSH